MTERDEDRILIEAFRPITWEIGTAELQRSVMADETIRMMHDRAVTNAEKMRSIIRQRRRLLVRKATGQWNDDPSEKFVNEHAWVLAEMVTHKLIVLINKRDQEYRLAPDALERLPALLHELRRPEQRVWGRSQPR